jgi:septal ring-binding cell division protein DamX
MMARKLIFPIMTVALLVTIFAGGAQSGPVRAQGEVTPTASATSDDDLDVRIEITGEIKSITPQSVSVSILTFTDGTEVKINPASQGADDLEPGMTITVIASLDDDDDQPVAKIITLQVATAAPTTPATVAPTAPATVPATAPATQQATCGSGNTHPVASRMADEFGVSYDEIMGWHCKGFGFGEIAKAYLLAKKTGKLPGDYFAMRSAGKGWGNIFKEEEVKPRDLAPGAVIRGKKNKGDATATATASADTNASSGPGNSGNKGNNGKGGKDNKDNSGNKGNNGKGKK